MSARAPDSDRVQRRALAMSAVVCRALLENDPPAQARPVHKRILEWLKRVGIEEELEASEKRLVTTAMGKLPEEEQSDGVWRAEGVVVLAWALGAIDLPAYDEPCEPLRVLDSLGFLQVPRTQARLRPRKEISAFRDDARALHWRLREFFLNPVRLEFAKAPWFGKRAKAFRLVNGDLAIGEHELALAEEASRLACHRTAEERHMAANWLCGEADLYSEVTTDT